MSQKSEEAVKSEPVKLNNQEIPQTSKPKVKASETSKTHVVSEVRCPHVLKNKHTGKLFRCNYKAMELRYGEGTTKCRNCRQIFSFEVNTTHVQFADGSSILAQNVQDILE